MAGLAAAGLLCLLLLLGLRSQVAAGLGDPGLAQLVPWVGLFLLPMLIASVLERLGVRAFIVLVPGHAR